MKNTSVNMRFRCKINNKFGLELIKYVLYFFVLANVSFDKSVPGIFINIG